MHTIRSILLFTMVSSDVNSRYHAFNIYDTAKNVHGVLDTGTRVMAVSCTYTCRLVVLLTHLGVKRHTSTQYLVRTYHRYHSTYLALP